MRKLHETVVDQSAITLMVLLSLLLTFGHTIRSIFKFGSVHSRTKVFLSIFLVFGYFTSYGQGIVCTSDLPVATGTTTITSPNGNVLNTTGNQAVNLTPSGTILPCAAAVPNYFVSATAAPGWTFLPFPFVNPTHAPFPGSIVTFPSSATPPVDVNVTATFFRVISLFPFVAEFENVNIANQLFGIDDDDPILFAGTTPTVECGDDIGAAATSSIIINDCSNTTSSAVVPAFDMCTLPTTVTVDITVTDDCGNSEMISVPVDIEDNTPPNANDCPDDIEVFLDANCQWTLTSAEATALSAQMVATATDACDPGPITVAVIAPVPDALNSVADMCAMPGMQAVAMSDVTFRLTDCNGQSKDTTCTNLITILDNTAPTWDATACSDMATDPSTTIQSLPIDPVGPPVVDPATCIAIMPDLRALALAELEDNCGATMSVDDVIQVPAPGTTLTDPGDGCGPAGNVVYTVDVSFNAVDCNGNAAPQLDCPGLVTVEDNVDPTYTCPTTPIPVTLAVNPATCAYESVTLPTDLFDDMGEEDNCDPDPVVTNPATVFDCNDLGVQDVPVTVTDCNGNSIIVVCQVEIIIDENDAFWDNPGPLCTSDGVIDLCDFLGADAETCGTWEGDEVTLGQCAPVGAGGMFDAAAAGPGSYSVTYTVGNPDCHTELTRTIQVEQNFDPELIDDFSVCWSPDEVLDLETLLAAGVPEGGEWTIVSQTPVLGGPVAGGLTLLSGPGNDHVVRYDGGCLDATIRYSLTDCAGNVESDDIVLTIQEAPIASFDLPGEFCQDEANYRIGGVRRTLSGCNDYDVMFEVVQGPGGPTQDLIGGSIVSGPITGFPAVIINPGVTAGRYTIRLTISDPNGVCPDVEHEETVIIHADAVNPNGIINNGPFCESATFPLLMEVLNPTDVAGNALRPADVRFFGPGVNDGPGITGRLTPPDTDNDGLPGPGTFTVCVNLGDARCLETHCEDFVIEDDIEDPDLVPDFTLCTEPDETIVFSGLLDADDLPGGIWSLAGAPTGSATGVLGPNGLIYTGGCGTITLQYAFPDDCNPPSAPAEVTITFNERPDIDLTTQGPLCVLDPAITIANNATVPVCGEFGTFTGLGITDNGDGTASFNPSVAGEGTHTINYTISTGAGCSEDGSVEIIVFAASDPTFTVNRDFCEDDAVVTLMLQNPDPSVLGGGSVVAPLEDGNVEVTWNAGCGACLTDNGDGTASFDPTQADIGTNLICVQTGDPNCAQSFCQLVVIHEGVDASLVADLNRGCFDFSQNGPFTDFDLNELYLPTTTRGGVWTYVSGPGGNIRNENISAVPGCHQLRYTVDAAFPGADGSCASVSDDVFLLLTEEPQPAFDLAEEVCWDGVAGSIQLSTLYNGDTWGDNSTRTYAWTVTQTSGTGPAPTIMTPMSMEPVIQIEGAGVFEVCLTETLTYGACGTQPVGIDCDNQICHLLSVTETAVEVIPTWTPVGAQCEDDARVYLGAASAGMGAGLVTGDEDGVFSGEGVVEDPAGSGEYYFDPTAVVIAPGSGSKDVNVCYTVNSSAGCTAVECHDIRVYEEANIDLFGGGNFSYLCQIPRGDGRQPLFDLSLMLNSGSTLGGTWTVLSGPGRAVNGFISGTAGCYELEYTVSAFPGADGACTETATTFIRLTEQPTPGFDLGEDVCWDGVPGSVTLPTIYNGNTFGNNATINYDWSINTVSGGPAPIFSADDVQEPTLSIQGAGEFEVCLTESMDYPACGGMAALTDYCGQTVCHTLTITETSIAVDASWTGVGPFCEDDARVYLGAASAGMGAGQVTGTPDGVFSGTGVVEDPSGSGEYYFDPSLITVPAGTNFIDVSVCYTVNSGAGCTAVQCQDIRVHGDVRTDLIGDVTLGCQNFNNGLTGPFIYFDLDRLLGPDATRGGTWTATVGSVAGDVLIASPGCTELTYTVTAFAGADGVCTATESMFLRLVENPMPAFSLAEEVCWDGVPGSIDLTTLYNGTTFGVNGSRVFDWTATVISGGPAPTFSADDIEEPTVSIQGAGMFEICLTESIDYPTCGSLAADNFCEQTVCHTLTVTETSVEVSAAWTPIGPFCEDDAREYLGAASAGMGAGQVTGDLDGVFTGTGVEEDPSGSGEYYFNPGVAGPGTHSICYTVNNGSGCTAVECHNFQVGEEVQINCQDNAVLPCATQRLGTQQTFGPFSSNLFGLPFPQVIVLESNYTLGTFSLDGLLCPGATRGGTWSLVSDAPGSPFGFIPSGAVQGNELFYTAPGCYTVNYTVESIPGVGGACSASQNFFVTIGESPVPSFDLPDEVCWSVGTPTITYDIPDDYLTSPDYRFGVTRSYSSSNPGAVSVGFFNGVVTVNGSGSATICMTENINTSVCPGVDFTSCTREVCEIITVFESNETVDPTWGPTDTLCVDDACLDLDALVTGTPGGEFTGVGVTEDPTHPNYCFNPSVAGAGTHAVTYTVNNQAGCSASFTRNIVVMPAVSADLNDIHIECMVAPSGNVSLAAMYAPGTTAGGTFTLLSGPSSASINGNTLIYSEAGCYELQYTVSAFSGADGACVDTETGFVLISEQPQPNFDIQDQVCFSDGDADVVLTPNVNSPTYDAASTLSAEWTITDNVTGATAAIDAMSGEVTLSDDAGPATISGTIEVCYEEELEWAACGSIAASTAGVNGDGCAESICMIITVEDGTALDATFAVSNDEPCPGDVVTLTANTSGGVFTGPGVTDNGNGTTGALQIGECGVYAVTYTLSSPGGCTNSYTANITTDRTAPSLTPPADMTVECDGAGNTTEMQAWLDQVTGSDNCTFSIDTILFNRISGCHSNVGSYVYQFIATDTCNNATTAFATFTIQDTTAPVITGGADMNMEECTAPPAGNFPDFDFWLSDNAGATADDLCGDRVFWSNNFDPANWMTTCGNARFVDVTFYAEDECQNVDSITHRFTIGDATPPMFTNCPRPEITASAPPTWCSAFVNFSPPAATDNCSNVTLTRLDGTGLESGDLFPVGITVLTWEARDECDNRDTCSLKVIVNDFHTPPTFACPPAPPTATNDPGLCGADVAAQLGVDLSPTDIEDNCPDNIAVTYEVRNDAGDVIGCGINSVNGFVFPVGTSEVKYRIQDQPILLITEIVQEGADAVEITNFGPAAMEISCLQIERVGNGDEIHIVPIGTILQAGDVYVASLTNDIGYTDPATYTIGIKGEIFDQINTNGFLMGGDIWRTNICDNDLESDWEVTVECKASLGMLNPGLPAFPPNGTQTGIQTVQPSMDMCTFDVTVVDNEAPSCKMSDTTAYDVPGIAGVMGEECISLDVTVPDNELIGGIILRDIDINYPNLTRLALSLRGPDGTEVEVFNRPCTNVPNMDADFADFGTRAMSDAGCTESLDAGELWVPEEAFKAFYGKQSQGTWTLELSLDGAGLLDIDAWSLEIIGLTDFLGAPVTIEVDPNTAPDMCGDTLDWQHPILFDNCCEGSMVVEYSTFDADTLPTGGPVVSGSFGSEFFGLGTTTVKYTLTDAVGNVAMCSFDVIVEDPLGLCTPDCQSNCQVSCIQDINVSLNENCEVPVVPSMVSEAINAECDFYYEIEIRDEHGNLLPSDTLTMDHVGHCYTVTLIEPECGNSCWTQVCVEDKFPPVLECPNDTMNCIEYQFGHDEPVVTEHCGTYTLHLVDEVISNRDCDPGFQKLVSQKWIAIDGSGNVSDTCEQEIWIERFPMGEIDIEVMDTTLYCGDNYEKLPGSDYPAPEVVGVPMFDTLGLYPLPDFFCNMLTDYEDVPLSSTGCTERFARMWKVTEWWCNSDSIRRFRQVITIVDTVGPEITMLEDTIHAKAGQRSCDALVDLPAIGLEDDCNDIDHVDIVYPGGFLGNSNGGQARIEIGTHKVVYRAFDECYNETTDTLIVVVEDEVAPIAICEQNTVVTLDNDGIVHVYADAFDDGSFDECKLEKMEVRRMTDNCGGGTDVWGDYVEFCCADIGSEVMVAFQVTDKSGNVNTCMVRATVQDKQPPQVVPLPDITVDCRFDWDSAHLEVFGEFVFDPALRDSIIIDAEKVEFSAAPLDGIIYDNCPPVVEEEVDFSGLSNCGLGYIIRYFTFTDGSGNVSNSRQIINIENDRPFAESQIDWPDHIDTSNVCGADNFRPRLLNESQAFPRFLDEDECSLVGYDYKDELIDASVGSEACYKIIRSWTVIDWCQVVNGVHPKWYFDQVIEVSNTVAPMITSACDDTMRCVFGPDCEPDSIALIATATDDCTASEDLFWQFKIDINNDGSFNEFGQSSDASGLYPIGVHRIKWIVEDRCGNQDSCEYIFELRNCKAPTAYCKNGVIAELTPMDTTGDGNPDTEMAEIWARDFDEGSSHPCGHPVVLSFSADTNDRVRFYDCDSLVPPIRPVTLWVTDRITGNVSKCQTFVNVQDNNGVNVCGGTTLTGNVSGLVKTQDDQAIAESEVNLMGSGMNGYNTNQFGEYSFGQVPIGGYYEIVPQKDTDYMEGVSTGDLIAIQRHLLGMTLLQSPYQYIAADVNNSENISSADIAALRKLILGVYDDLPKNTSWRFVDKAYQFPNPTDPWEEEFPEEYEISPLEQDMAVDFVGVKIGDVNQDIQLGANANQTRNVAERKVILEDGQVKSGRMYEVMFNMEELSDLAGYQFAIEWNMDKLDLVELVPNLSLDMSLGHFGMQKVDEGLITTSWNTDEPGQIASGEERLFAITFEAKSDGLLSEMINITQRVTLPEAYAENAGQIETERVVLEFRGGQKGNYFALYQNEPNPWNQSTTIGFHLPSRDAVQLTLFDETGRLIQRIEQWYNEGYNEIQLDAGQIQGGGVLYYRLETAAHTATRKMILLD